ncbi:hypothetical protein A3J13_01520 [Candidatus Daviesbacteria bacterium RIFCSPLOWO2_02_FULL_36_8]|uniref:Diacylglycerol kinase n=1 Tax=Candidatus Daviesbacteria bacterium RIFCSPLOWO2_02_FULL_36_8 TaxID=1797793 RepID=A0A1F5MGE5_9BACT|nr:MAG: hypothetical protein A3J13_01520 [Candidatus Daviesbacteria bacterium RIFCSPLOWO2_02_FULL_36_8]
MSSKKLHILSFKYAFEGLLSALKEEPKLIFHLLVAFLVILISGLLNISRTDWIIVVLAIGLVITVELTNTAIEAVVDHLIQTEHPGAKLAKDISAAAVLVAAITATVVGILIFLPYFNL